MHEGIARLQGGLIVSCQASKDDGLYGPEVMAGMARAAELGGAVGIRANGPDDIAAIRRAVRLPIVGIYKRDLPGYGIRITPTLEAARQIVEAGADIVAIDATRRGPSEGRLPTAELIRQIHDTLHVPVMADISTLEEGIAAAEAGADIVASTLSGYTPYSPALKRPTSNWSDVARTVQPPVIAEVVSARRRKRAGCSNWAATRWLSAR
jgi:putative N-acetylmannosamine-6-phosphate epimerase